MTAAKRTILIVEDEALIALQERKKLEQAGYAVLHALSGEEAVGLMAEKPGAIDLILMDIDLGKGIDGTEAARRILALRDLPIIFLSSHMEPEIVARTEEITSYGYVVKSSVFTVLEASIKMAFRLSQSEDKFSRLFHANPDYITLSGVEDGRLMDVNDGFCRLTGYSREEALGHSVLPGDLDIWADPAERTRFAEILAREGRIDNRELKLRRKDGSFFMANTFGRVIEVNGKRCVIAVASDISERKRIEDELRRSERRNRKLVEASPDGIVEVAGDGRIVFASRRCAYSLGFRSADEFVGRNIADFLAPGEHGRARHFLERALRGEESRDAEFVLIRSDGSAMVTETSAELFMAEEQGAPHLILAIRDITTRKEALTALRAEEDKHLKLINDMGEGFCYVDEGEVFRLANPTCDRVFGVPPGSLLGRSLWEFVDGRGRDILSTQNEMRAAGESSEYVLPILRPDGGERWIRVIASPLDAQAGRYAGASAIFRDITEELANREALHRLVNSKETLMKELEHRVKNSFALVSSLLSIARGELEDPRAQDVIQDTETRIRSMALIYERLYLASSAESLDFGAYVEDLAQSIIAAFSDGGNRVELSVSADHLELDTKRAISLGLILNELLTNALKYAFPAGRPGLIRVEFSAKDGRGRLCVSDNGVGLPDSSLPSHSPTMGMTLIRLLAEQVGGGLAVGPGPGTSIAVGFSPV